MPSIGIEPADDDRPIHDTVVNEAVWALKCAIAMLLIAAVVGLTLGFLHARPI